MKSVASLAAAVAVLIAAAAPPSVKAVILQQRASKPDETTLIVRLEPTGFVLGAYQGTFRFAPASLTIVAATTPAGDGTRVVNPADSAKGIIRFAGYTTSAFKSTDIITVIVRSLRPLANASLAADFPVVADVNGVAIPKDQITPARGIRTDPSRD